MPFRLLESIEGRTDDVLTLPAVGRGTVEIHPIVFHQVLDLADAAEWQVRQHDHLSVLIAGPGPNFNPDATARAVQAALTQAGAAISARLCIVDAIPAGAAGKRPLVVAQPLMSVPRRDD
jgi:hypothetical protein